MGPDQLRQIKGVVDQFHQLGHAERMAAIGISLACSMGEVRAPLMHFVVNVPQIPGPSVDCLVVGCTSPVMSAILMEVLDMLRTSDGQSILVDDEDAINGVAGMLKRKGGPL